MEAFHVSYLKLPSMAKSRPIRLTTWKSTSFNVVPPGIKYLAAF